MNLDQANALVSQLKPSNEELTSLLDAHLNMTDIKAMPDAKFEHYREAAAQAAVIRAAHDRGEPLDFDVRTWIGGFPPFPARLFFVKKLTGLSREIGLP